MSELKRIHRAYEFARTSVSIPENKKSPWHGIFYRVLGAIGLLDPTEGLEVSQRKIDAKDAGKKPGELIETGELVISVIRNGTEHRFTYQEIGTLQLGDEIVAVKPVD